MPSSPSLLMISFIALYIGDRVPGSVLIQRRYIRSKAYLRLAIPDSHCVLRTELEVRFDSQSSLLQTPATERLADDVCREGRRLARLGGRPEVHPDTRFLTRMRRVYDEKATVRQYKEVREPPIDHRQCYTHCDGYAKRRGTCESGPNREKQ